MLITKSLRCSFLILTLGGPVFSQDAMKINLAPQTETLPSFFSGDIVRRVSISRDVWELSFSDQRASRVHIAMGRVPTSSTTVIALPVVNDSDGEVRCIKVDTSCGCFALLGDRPAVIEGQSYELDLQIVGPESETQFARTIDLEFEVGRAKLSNKLTVVLEGEARRLFNVKPKTLDVSMTDRKGSTHEMFVEPNFSDIDPSGFTVSGSDRLVKSWTSIAKEGSVKGIFVGVELRPSLDLPFSEYTEVLRLSSSGGVAEIPFMISLRGRFYPRPSRFVFTSDELRTNRNRLVIVASDPEESVVIKSAELFVDGEASAEWVHVGEIVSARNIGVFAVSLKHGNIDLTKATDIRLDVFVNGQSVPLSVPIFIRN